MHAWRRKGHGWLDWSATVAGDAWVSMGAATGKDDNAEIMEMSCE